MSVAKHHLLLSLLVASCGSSKATPPSDAGHVSLDAGMVQLGHVDVLMQHNDMARTGQNLHETVLTQANVTAQSFGKLKTLPVDGLLYAQPLIVTDTMINGAAHDVLLVATLHNSVYAFDANTYEQLYMHNLGPSVPASEIGPINPATGKPQGGINIQVEVGIVATPVIDRGNGLVYLTRKSWNATTSTQSTVMHVLSLATGQDMPGSPVTIAASLPGPDGYGASPVVFDTQWQLQRTSLLLMGNTAYFAFASHEDFEPYHGWIMGYTYDVSAQTLTQTQLFCDTPDGTEGGIWNSGQGLLSDGTDIYALTSNGTVNQPMGGKSYGEAFLRLNTSLVVQDWFTPVEWSMLNAEDIDLGSGGPVLIPGTSPPLLVGGGKEGKLYVVDSTSMGHLGVTDDMNTQEWPLVPPPDARSIYGSPVLWTGSPTQTLFIWAVGDFVRKFAMTGATFNETPVALGTVSNLQVGGQDPVGNLAITSSGSTAGTGILWGMRPNANPDHTTVAGTFYAFSADDLHTLWSSAMNSARDGMGSYAKFVPPTVANGKVYLATHSNQLLVYGLLGDAQ